MLALLGIIIGFLSSIVGPLVSLYNKKLDHVHETEMFKLNVDLVKFQHEATMHQLEAQADVAESATIHQSAMPIGVRWVDALNALVRPVFSYAFFACYVIVKFYAYGQTKLLLSTTANFVSVMAHIWGPEDMAIFCTIVAFWFGNRTFGKMLGYEGDTKPMTWVIKDLPKLPNGPSNAAPPVNTPVQIPPSENTSGVTWVLPNVVPPK
jgi:hypothetical protein